MAKKRANKKNKPMARKRSALSLKEKAAFAHPSPQKHSPSWPWAEFGKSLLVVLVVLGALMVLGMSLMLKPEKVSVNYLFSPSCDYCTQAQPRVEQAVAAMNGQVSLYYLDASARANNATLAALYTHYKDTGLFGGFPTLVATGPKGTSALVGLRNESEVQSWLCAQFNHPPPACSRTG